jgi:hypothetical protein
VNFIDARGQKTGVVKKGFLPGHRRSLNIQGRTQAFGWSADYRLVTMSCAKVFYPELARQQSPGSSCRFYFPVPVRETVCGLVLALSFMFIVAVRVPVACGVNVTEIVHLLLAGTLPPQLLVAE